MKVNFTLTSFDEKYMLFKDSLKESGIILEEGIAMKAVAIFLGYKNIDKMIEHCKLIKNENALSKISSFLKTTFTTSLISHSQDREFIIGEDDKGNLVFKDDVVKKYTYQKFKTGVSKVSQHLKSEGIKVPNLSLLKAFAVFLGYKNWNTLSSVIKEKREKVYNVFNDDYDLIVETAFLALEEGVDNVYFVNVDKKMLANHYLKCVTTLKHKYKVPFKEILKIKIIKKEDIKSNFFDGRPLCFISPDQLSSDYIYENHIKRNKKYQIES